MCPFDYTAFAVSVNVGIPLNNASWVDVVTPANRPKPVRNHCIIEVLVALLCCHFALNFLLVQGFLSYD